jgi:hypothetical protein
MRLLYTALLCVLMAGATVTAPTAQAQLLPSFGLTGGLNFGSLSDAATVDLDESTGYHIGVFSDFGFGPVGVRGSLMYVRAGNLGLPIVGGGGDAVVSFIALPVDLQYRAGTPLVNPYALFGPELRFPLGDLADADARSVAVALNLGVGASFGAFIGPTVFAELRYAFDVTGFFDDGVAGVPASVDDSVKLNIFYLRIGVGL